MSENMMCWIVWFVGWLIMSIGNYVYKVYIDKDTKVNKKVHAWRAFWLGMFSWIGIFFVITFFITGCIALLGDWVENKLNNV